MNQNLFLPFSFPAVILVQRIDCRQATEKASSSNLLQDFKVVENTYPWLSYSFESCPCFLSYC